MKAATMAQGDAGKRSKQAVLVKPQPDDLFPHLDSLVPSDLSIWQVIGEGSRLLSQHFKSFLLPILFITLSVVSSILINLWQMGGAFGMVILSSLGSSESLWKDALAAAGWLWVVYIANIVLASCAEVGFHRAVVGAYLKERYGTDDGPDHSIGGFILAALRCAWSYCANAIVFAVIGAVVGSVCFLLLGYLEGVVLAIVVAFVVLLFLSGEVILSAFFTLSLPVSALTTTSGFQALKRSFLLTRGNFKSCFGLNLTFVLVSMVIMVPLAMAVTQQQFTGSAAFLLLVSSVGELINSIIWAPCRTVLYLKLRAWPEADSLEGLLDVYDV